MSTKRQGESGLGLEAQRAYIKHFYSGKKVIGEFIDIKSGKDVDNRPELQKAIALCKKEKAVLVVAKIDRLSRNTEQALSIYQELDGRLESCDLPNLDEFTLTVFIAITDRERELISIRTRQALTAKKKRDGEWRRPGKGLADPDILGRSVRTITGTAAANENNRRAAETIAEKRKLGMSWSAIAALLNKTGFLTARGKQFQAVQVKRIFQRGQA
jgi:DNA invertase Pin-like site-specific DNA recombinase